MAPDELERLLAEQVAYYRARAGEYDASAPWEADPDSRRRLADALRDFGPRGRVLELACGTGVWTAELVEQCDELAALDASPEMIALRPGRRQRRSIRLGVRDPHGRVAVLLRRRGTSPLRGAQEVVEELDR